MDRMSTVLSIVTPTYNRGEMLWKCYDSLEKQTCSNFEWIVVDDGSEDNTSFEVKEMIEKASHFPVYYVRKENGGKHTALNESHSLIHGDYVLILDSDDSLTPDAVENILSGWNRYADDESVSMVTFLKQQKNGQVCAYAMGECIPMDVLRHRRVCNGPNDCAEVIRASLFKKYPFPVFEGERFLAETALWYRAGLDGNCVYINKAIYICEYLKDGLTKSGKSMRVKNPQGGMYTSYLRMNRRCFMKERIKAGLLYVCYAHFAGESAKNTIRNAAPYQALVSLCYVPGTILYWIWKKKYR